MNDAQFRFFNEFCCYVKLPVESSISQVFNNSFDSVLNEYIVNFTSNEMSASHLSIVIPQKIIKEAKTKTKIKLSSNSLTIGTNVLDFAGYIEQQKCSNDHINKIFLTENIRLLENNIRLFGKNSIVKKMLFAGHNDLVSLKDVSSICESDFMDFMPFVGAGEGLTPSFDDFLAALIFSDTYYKTAYLAVPEQFYVELKYHTTKQAAQQYLLASKASFTIQFEEFIKNFFCSKLKSYNIVKLLNWGHSSGTDILCGFLFYARLFCKHNSL